MRRGRELIENKRKRECENKKGVISLDFFTTI